MTETRPKSSRVRLLVSCVLVFAAAFFVGQKNALPAPKFTGDADSVALAGERYKIPVSLSQPKRGPADALVTIVEWCDLRGAACRNTNRVVKELQTEYGDAVRYVYRHYADEASENGTTAHELAHMAFEQFGKFWELRDILLQNDVAPSREELESIANHLGMNLKDVRAGLERHSHAGYVASDGLFAARFGVTSAPTLFVNGTRLLGEPTKERLKTLIELELEHAQNIAQTGVSRAELYDEITQDGLWEHQGAHVAKKN